MIAPRRTYEPLRSVAQYAQSEQIICTDHRRPRQSSVTGGAGSLTMIREDFGYGPDRRQLRIRTAY